MIYDHTKEDQGKTQKQREDSLKGAFFIIVAIITGIIGWFLFVCLTL